MKFSHIFFIRKTMLFGFGHFRTIINVLFGSVINRGALLAAVAILQNIIWWHFQSQKEKYCA